MHVQKLSITPPLDLLLDGGIEHGSITNMYGPAGSGKSNVCMLAAARVSAYAPVVYLDTEGSFSRERFAQLGGTEEQLKRIILVNIHDWQEQCREMQAVKDLITQKPVKLIIVDSLVAQYRAELDQTTFRAMNAQLAQQYALLSKWARTRHMPVLVTNQVYQLGEDQIELTSNAIAKYWSKILIELKRKEQPNQRIAILRKHRSLPEGKKVAFEIVQNGLQHIPSE